MKLSNKDQAMRSHEEKHKSKEKKNGGVTAREWELPVAIATTGTLVQSPRQCLVARESFRQREMGAAGKSTFP